MVNQTPMAKSSPSPSCSPLEIREEKKGFRQAIAELSENQLQTIAAGRNRKGFLMSE
jgi:hypothetical protein